MISSKPNVFASALDSYQKKLGSYDQQQWEKTIEERVLKGLSHAIPKKVTRVKTELIDLDLIRGSAFTKAKPKQGYIATTYLGILRVIFFPFYWFWWKQQTNSLVTCLLLFLYSAQITSMYMYFYPSSALHIYHQFDLIDFICSMLPPFDVFFGDFSGRLSSSDTNAFTQGSSTTTPVNKDMLKELEDIPASEVITPVIMFLILSVIQSHIAASHSLDERSRNRIEQDCSPRATSNKQTGSTSVSNSRPGSTSRSLYPGAGKRKKRSPEKKSSSSLHNVTSHETQQTSSDQGIDTSSRNASVAQNIQVQNQEGSKKPSDEESGLEIRLMIQMVLRTVMFHRLRLEQQGLQFKTLLMPMESFLRPTL